MLSLLCPSYLGRRLRIMFIFLLLLPGIYVPPFRLEATFAKIKIHLIFRPFVMLAKSNFLFPINKSQQGYWGRYIWVEFPFKNIGLNLKWERVEPNALHWTSVTYDETTQHFPVPLSHPQLTNHLLNKEKCLILSQRIWNLSLAF